MLDHMEKALQMALAFELLDAYFQASLMAFEPPLNPLLTLEYGCYFMDFLLDTVDHSLLATDEGRADGTVV